MNFSCQQRLSWNLKSGRLPLNQCAANLVRSLCSPLNADKVMTARTWVGVDATCRTLPKEFIPPFSYKRAIKKSLSTALGRKISPNNPHDEHRKRSGKGRQSHACSGVSSRGGTFYEGGFGQASTSHGRQRLSESMTTLKDVRFMAPREDSFELFGMQKPKDGQRVD